ncbi:O-methyltransferase [Pontivivens ytuae]|uniref:Class I SAM-dependent methyltransferase n=1 Tax=Pontivivens ytuae TaxID=2789856 RepID=A0A7S9QB37_9RHOB|nr:class I SAM-dependent methyltransferase [Pontivivens ytuae]QPH52448.1 class I SAM-dependent methyltransferase [Pontivivens ytuae]
MATVFDGKTVKRLCNGMMEPEVYEEIYRVGRDSPLPHMVEVGTGHGAGAISLAMGLRDSGRVGKVYTIDRIMGGSRDRFGGLEQNETIIRRNIAHFGLEDYVEFIVGDAVSAAEKIPADIRFGVMLLDADGRLDRDFKLFYDRLVDGGGVILDDVKAETRAKIRRRGVLAHDVRIDQKHLIAHHLHKLFERHGLLTEGQTYFGNTWIGQKNPAKFSDVPQDDILECYRSLVFTRSSLKILPLRARLARIGHTVLPRPMVRVLKEKI